METLKNLVHELLVTNDNPTVLLQRINEQLLKNYQLSMGDYLTVLPKEVEIYYVNRKAPKPFIDANMHCMLDPKTDAEIWKLQSNRFGQIYCHKKGLGGIDVCLSDSNDYALCCTIKAALVNGEESWSPLKVRNAVIKAVGEHEHLSERLDVMDRLNDLHAEPSLHLREQPLSGYVYNLRRRGLRRRDKNVVLPLRSFIDLWNDKLLLSKVQKISLYMEAHPTEKVLDVLRANNFHYIPTEIKIRYKIDSRARLFEQPL